MSEQMTEVEPGIVQLNSGGLSDEVTQSLYTLQVLDEAVLLGHPLGGEGEGDGDGHEESLGWDSQASDFSCLTSGTLATMIPMTKMIAWIKLGHRVRISGRARTTYWYSITMAMMKKMSPMERAIIVI